MSQKKIKQARREAKKAREKWLKEKLLLEKENPQTLQIQVKETVKAKQFFGQIPKKLEQK